jgi:hypothetical protein
MEFPKIIHPREKMVYKLPELNDCIYLAHPYGKQCYAWFTGKVCYLVDRQTKKQFTIQVDFDSLDGTILFGSTFHLDGSKFFLIDNIFYHKGEKVECSYREKINLFHEILTCHIRNHTSSYLFMLPHISTSMIEIEPIYKVYCIKIIHESITYHYIQPSNKKIFTIKSTCKSDIYELYDKEFHSIACIDTLQCSEFMNKLFHPTDTYVESEKKMECVWNETFKKWTPVKIKE